MKKYNVLISDKALRDMEAIYEYIALELLSPETAMRLYNRISDSILSLEAMPERIKIMDSEPEHSLGFRRLLVDHYSAFFVIRGEDVHVVRVLYSASDIEKRLNED
ncbi:MAG: type II toxin-antitoxin system RelE/ParE family toxin [Synergistaceae bacterium]|jgi:plasmid stabilization system protein ParE|nr:type II toxin-antitoxin system RelE/ParE family toxin [Synergistaceae bacterium]